jgi:hypothetical protein
LGYEGFNAGYPGLLIWTGSALPSSAGTKGGGAYSGVGLEMYANTSSYFRYSTADSEIDVRTNKFFFGNNSTFISGSNGNLQISSSGFKLSPQGNVTASSFLAVSGSTVLFDTNNRFADALNIGRVIYFDQAETSLDLSLIDGGVANAQTASVFQTFILPGETKCQVSFTYEIDNTSGVTAQVLMRAYVATASLGPTGSSAYYGAFQNNSLLSGDIPIGTSVAAGTIESGAQTSEVSSGTTFAARQGMYAQIYLVAYIFSAGRTGTIKMKNFVWRTSRAVGGSIASLPGGTIIIDS